MFEMHILPNPHSGSPERRITIAKRITTVLGCIATSGFAFKFGIEANNLSAEKELFFAISGISFALASLPIINELEERYFGIDDEGDGGGGGWTPPESFPDPPLGGFSRSFIEEVELYLEENVPVSV